MPATIGICSAPGTGMDGVFYVVPALLKTGQHQLPGDLSPSTKTTTLRSIAAADCSLVGTAKRPVSPCAWGTVSSPIAVPRDRVPFSRRCARRTSRKCCRTRGWGDRRVRRVDRRLLPGRGMLRTEHQPKARVPHVGARCAGPFCRGSDCRTPFSSRPSRTMPRRKSRKSSSL